IGFRQTDSPLVLVLNSDTIVPAGAVDQLVRQMLELPGAAVVGPRLVNGKGEAELSFGRMMGPLAERRQKYVQRLAGQSRIEGPTWRFTKSTIPTGRLFCACIWRFRASCHPKVPINQDEWSSYRHRQALSGFVPSAAGKYPTG